MPPILSFAKYERDGAYHWDAFNRPTLYRRHALFLKDLVTERPLLDVGCGDGLLTSILGAEGIDISLEGLRLGRLHGANVRYGSAEAPPAGPYRAALLSDILEHLPEPERAVEALGAVTRCCYVSVPFHGPGLFTDEFHYRHFESLEDLDELFLPRGWHRVWSSLTNLKWYAKYRRGCGLYLRDRWKRRLQTALRSRDYPIGACGADDGRSAGHLSGWGI